MTGRRLNAFQNGEERAKRAEPESVELGAGRRAEYQVDALNRKIQSLHRQQHLIVDLLKELKQDALSVKILDKKSWVQLLRSAGMDEKAMGDWHRAFEQLSAEAHRHFLESLGIPAEEVDAIRRWSRGKVEK